MENNIFDIGGKVFNLDGTNLSQQEIAKLKELSKAESKPLLLELKGEVKINFLKKLDQEIENWKKRKIEGRTAQHKKEIEGYVNEIKSTIYSNTSSLEQRQITDKIIGDIDFKRVKSQVLKNKNNPRVLNEMFNTNFQIAKGFFVDIGYNFPGTSFNAFKENSSDNPNNLGIELESLLTKDFNEKISSYIAGIKYLIACCLITPGFSYNGSSIEGITKRYISKLITSDYAKTTGKDSVFNLFKSMGLKDKDIFEIFSHTLDPFIDRKSISNNQYKNIEAFAKNFKGTKFDSFNTQNLSGTDKTKNYQHFLRLVEVHKKDSDLNIGENQFQGDVPSNTPVELDNNLPGYKPLPGYENN